MENSPLSKIPRKFIENYTRSNYRVVGKQKHTAIKPCHWVEQKLLTGRDNRNCYKGYFGIKSELCIQNSPSYPFCNHNCVFCWRDTENGTLGSKFTVKPDDPEYIVGELIRHQKNLIKHHFPLEKNLYNFEIMLKVLDLFWKKFKAIQNSEKSQLNKIRLNTDHLSIELNLSKTEIQKAVLLLKNMKILQTEDLKSYFIPDFAQEFLFNSGGDIHALLDKYVTNESDIKEVHKRGMNPGHAAISLDGEPTLYPYIGEFVSGFRRRKFTTFIVSNGTTPEIISRMNENGTLPTQLYITIPPPDLKNYRKICRPQENDTWEKLQKTISMIKDLKTRTCFRITSVRELNVRDELIEEYANYIEEAQPDFLDIKGFTLEGSSLSIGKRMGKGDNYDNSTFVPDFEYLMNFAKKLEIAGGFEIIETHEKSRDILLRVAWPKHRSIVIKPDQV